MIPWPCVKGFSFSMEWSLTLDKNGAPNVLFVKRTCIFGCLYPMLLLWFLQPEPITGESKKKWREQMQENILWALFEGRHQEMLLFLLLYKKWSLKRNILSFVASLAWMLNSWSGLNLQTQQLYGSLSLSPPPLPCIWPRARLLGPTAVLMDLMIDWALSCYAQNFEKADC